MKLSAPGKTFLVGEYLALEGGPSLLVSTGPKFDLALKSASTKGSQSKGPFHESSPAGRFLQLNHEFWKEIEVSFIDPHLGKGGLGASSAQFALLYAFQKGWREIDLSTVNWREILDVYRKCAWNGEGSPPSGADVVSQLVGGVTWFDGRNHLVKKMSWRFPALSFLLVRTGMKLATHEHLKSRQGAPYENLREIVSGATNALESGNETEFVDSIKAYAQELNAAGLVADGTKSILNELESHPEMILAAKGCGAMGADVVLILHKIESTEAVKNWAHAEGLEICGGLESLATGLSIGV